MTDALEAAKRILDYWDVASGRMPRSPHSQDEVIVAHALEAQAKRVAELEEALSAIIADYAGDIDITRLTNARRALGKDQ